MFDENPETLKLRKCLLCVRSFQLLMNEWNEMKVQFFDRGNKNTKILFVQSFHLSPELSSVFSHFFLQYSNRKHVQNKTGQKKLPNGQHDNYEGVADGIF